MTRCEKCGRDILEPVILVTLGEEEKIRVIGHYKDSNPYYRNFQEAGITLARYLYDIMTCVQFDSLLAELERLSHD